MNLASAKVYAGNGTAFTLWAKAAEMMPGGLQGGMEVALRNNTNWAMGALAFGAYEEGARVADVGLALCQIPFWRNSFHAAKAWYSWRTGDWDSALDEVARASSSIVRAEIGEATKVIASAIRLEREKRPDVQPLRDAYASLLARHDEEWAAIASSILIHTRAARREPNPTRGLLNVAEMIKEGGVRLGWEDLLIAAATVEPRSCRAALGVLGELRPVGRRGEASMLLCQGLLELDARGDSARRSLLNAADAFEALGEPFLQAQACEAAAMSSTTAGTERRQLLIGAAHTYRSLGADRSLAALLRRAGRTRALEGFRVPKSQARSAAPGLTPREREVAELAGRGRTAGAIAEELTISEATARKHLERIKDKLGVARKSDLVELLNDRLG